MHLRRQFAIAAGLLMLACGAQAVLVWRAPLPALDTVQLVRIAQRIDEFGLTEILRGEQEQPLFPVSVWLVHEGVARIVGDFRWAWVQSAQLAAAAALALTVVPVYFLSLRLVGPAGAAAGALFFCVLPKVSRLGADGIGDSVHLLLFTLAIWAAVRYLTASVASAGRAEGLTWLLAAGLATGLAVLARAESLILPAALVVFLVASALVNRTRSAWSETARAAACFLVGFALILGPYLAWMGSLTPRAAVCRILGRDGGAAPVHVPSQAHGAAWRLPDGESMSFAAKDPTTSIRRRGWLAAADEFFDELTAGCGYWIGALALVGAWSVWRPSMRRVDRFAVLFFCLYALAAIAFAAKEGYLDSRHLLPLVVLGMGTAGHGAMEAGWWMAGLIAPSSGGLAGRAVRIAVAALAVIALGPAWIRPIHGGQQGHRLAAEWLASRSGMPGAVLDTRGWTGLYSGRPTYPYEDAAAAIADRRLAYVVVEDRELERPSDRGRTLRWLLATAAEPAAAFVSPGGRQVAGYRVVVYRWFPDRFAQHAPGAPGAWPASATAGRTNVTL